MNVLINLREEDIEMEEAWRVFAIYQQGLFLGLSAPLLCSGQTLSFEKSTHSFICGHISWERCNTLPLYINLVVFV